MLRIAVRGEQHGLPGAAGAYPGVFSFAYLRLDEQTKAGRTSVRNPRPNRKRKPL